MFGSSDTWKKKKADKQFSPKSVIVDLTILLIDLTFQIIQGLLKLGLFPK